MRNLGNDPSPVSRTGVRAHSTAVLQVTEGFESFLDNVVPGGSPKGCHHR